MRKGGKIVTGKQQDQTAPPEVLAKAKALGAVDAGPAPLWIKPATATGPEEKTESAASTLEAAHDAGSPPRRLLELGALERETIPISKTLDAGPLRLRKEKKEKRKRRP